MYVKDPSVKAAQGEVPAGFREVTVETGIMNDEQVEVTSGLAEGDEVYLVQVPKVLREVKIWEKE